jgi:DNA gyrase inhibitor GyrI
VIDRWHLSETGELDIALLFVIAFRHRHLQAIQTPMAKKTRRTTSMNHGAKIVLDVSIQDLPTVHVAYIDYQASSEQGDLHSEIRACFQRVQSWVARRGHDPYSLLNVGVPNVDDGQLMSYECCVQIPEDVQGSSDDVDIKDLPGGLYAVVKIDKDPQAIGDSIAGFYQEYVPKNNIRLDGTRPTYEIYWEDTMEYCVPIR